jgi:hypothetical protein
VENRRAEQVLPRRGVGTSGRGEGGEMEKEGEYDENTVYTDM